MKQLLPPGEPLQSTFTAYVQLRLQTIHLLHQSKEHCVSSRALDSRHVGAAVV